MKHLEKIILLLLAFGLLTGLHTGSTIGIVASAFTLLAGCYFFYRNTYKDLALLRSGSYRKFLLVSLLPLAIIYVVAVVLNIFYGLSYVENKEFQFRYFTTPFPHKESAFLPTLYALGLFYGYLRTNKKAIRVTIATAGLVTLLGLAYINLPTDSIFRQDQSYHQIAEVTSLEALVNTPEFRDKTVYIDLWYSSCGPCIKQFKNHLENLKSDLVRNDLEVEFVYLARATSHPDSRQRWSRAIEKYNLKGWHYYFSKEQAPQLWDEISKNLAESAVRGYPHYLIAKNGKIYSYQAPMPEASQELISMIKQL